MAPKTPVTFNHFCLIRFTPQYWEMEHQVRTEMVFEWFEQIRRHVDELHIYQSYGAGVTGDLLMWCARVGEPGSAPVEFFNGFARAAAPVRTVISVNEVLWGFTRPSQYTKTRSRQEMSADESKRMPYLIVYPFVKTTEWYVKDRDERQKMMAEHIKVGKRYADIKQLLLYSFGLQDQEFVVVYETEDLRSFSDLVNALRATEARLYTERDSPLHLGIYQPTKQDLAAWL